METTRRNLNRAVAWSVPVVAVAATAPAYAASLRKDPGINGWVLVTTSDQDNNSYDLRFDSDEPGVGPDGAPYGLYVYDPNRTGNTLLDLYTNASVTIWLRTDRDSTPANNGMNRTGAGWSNATDAGLETKPDGLQYRGFRFNYSGSYTLVAAEERVYLTDLIVTTNDVNSSDATYWVQRAITVNGVVQTFQRRNGARGAFMGADVQGRSAQNTEKNMVVAV